MTKFISILLFLLCTMSVSAQLPSRQVRDLKTGRMPDDTSYIYWLPYQVGKKFLFVQGANSGFSHKGELAYDFKMKKGSKVCAARNGIVTGARGDSDKGGLKDEYMDDGNYVIIEHADGSTANYWHLDYHGVSVKVGDTVQKGQLIGLSGNTGYTAFPHLHFQVFDKWGKEILVRFHTRTGYRYLRPGKWYKNVR